MNSFIDINWLEENPLTQETVISYFARSPFYDDSCLNESLRMQTQFSNFFNIHQKLQEMDGLRYVVEERNDIFYIFKIDKQNDEEKLIDFYFVLAGTIFKGSTQASVTKSRVHNFLFYVNESIEKFFTQRHFDPFKGFSFKSNFQQKEQKKENIEDAAIRDYVLQELVNEAHYKHPHK